MSQHLESKRPSPIIATQVEFPEPLTQSPMTAETAVIVRDDEKANPHLPEEEQKMRIEYGHLCSHCGEAFNCVGDENGNHATDLCVCEQAIAAYPEPHLIFYCSYECSLEESDSDLE